LWWNVKDEIMKIGLYFGSFNPVHVGHLIIANHIAYHSSLDKVWLVVSPRNPFKDSEQLLNEYDRLHLVGLAVENEPRLQVSNIEFSLPRPSYTIDTLTYLQEKYPDTEFTIIMGSDGIQNIEKWKNAETILNNYPILVYIRPGFEKLPKLKGNISVLEAPMLSISSTHIRQCILNGKSIRYLVPDLVLEEIERSGYYLKKQRNKLAKGN
jgi:nicotinate-nucleotide adenylyltransferase